MKHAAQTNPNPRRPYKAIASALVAALTVLVVQGADLLPAWLLLLVAAAVAGLATFLVPNPPDPPRDRTGSDL